jgi:hypothetical protein
MSFIKKPSKKIKKNKKIYIEERKNIKKYLSKRSEKLRADQITTLGGSLSTHLFSFCKGFIFSLLQLLFTSLMNHYDKILVKKKKRDREKPSFLFFTRKMKDHILI